MQDKIALANSLLSLLERVDALSRRDTIPPGMCADARRLILEQLTLLFPPLPPPPAP